MQGQTVVSTLVAAFTLFAAHAHANTVSQAALDTVQKAYLAGDYRSAAISGARLLASDPKNESLRLRVANSLAWTGRYDAAIEQYTKLFGSAFERDARVGIANIEKWRGRPELAEAGYKQVLAKHPTDSNANKAAVQLGRDIKDALNVKLSDAQDNSKFHRRDVELSWRHWTDDRRFRFEPRFTGGGDSFAGNSYNFTALGGTVQAPSWFGAPKLDAAFHRGSSKGVFATLEMDALRSVKPELLQLRAGKVDFARMAFNRTSQLAELSANRFGLSSRIETFLGVASLRGDLYKISDSNQITDLEAKFTPAWQPLPYGVDVELGYSSRKADKTVANYWSPSKTAYSLGTIGVKKGWYTDDAEMVLAAQYGVKLSDEARNNVSMSARGKYWFDDELAFGMEFWYAKAPRLGDYSTRTFSLSIQRLF